MEKQKEDKIANYEDFIENQLKVDLKEVEDILKQKSKSYMEWEDLQQTINIFKRFKDRDVNLQVPIGCGIFVNAETSEYDRVLINIGLGCHLELDYKEATAYAGIRMRAIQREIDHYRDLAAKVKANIKIVLLGINELRESSGSNKS